MTDSLLCTAPYDCASPRPLLLVSSKVQLHILRVVRHRLTEKTTTTKKKHTHNRTNYTTASSLQHKAGDTQ